MLAKQAETLDNVTKFLNPPALELCEPLLSRKIMNFFIDQVIRN